VLSRTDLTDAHACSRTIFVADGLPLCSLIDVPFGHMADSWTVLPLNLINVSLADIPCPSEISSHQSSTGSPRASTHPISIAGRLPWQYRLAAAMPRKSGVQEAKLSFREAVSAVVCAFSTQRFWAGSELVEPV
jgi:hypothetical protein